MVISAPSGSGKTILLQSMILDIYRNCFARIYIFSPSINVDSIWTPVKKYIKDEMKVDTEKEQCFFGEYIASDLQQIIEQHHKVIEYQKKNDHKTLHSCLLIIDDMADNEKFSRHSSLLNQLYVRGRHNALTVITSVQAYQALSRIIRVNSRQLFFRKGRCGAPIFLGPPFFWGPHFCVGVTFQVLNAAMRPDRFLAISTMMKGG